MCKDSSDQHGLMAASLFHVSGVVTRVGGRETVLVMDLLRTMSPELLAILGGWYELSI